MNRREAKALAMELGIGKDEVRQFGSLSKTQSWVDALAAHPVPLLGEQESLGYSAESCAAQSSESAAVGVSEAESVTPLPQSCPALPLPGGNQSETGPGQTSATGAPALGADSWVEEPWGQALENGGGDAGLETESEVPAPGAALYPLLVLCVVVWLLCRLLLGLGYVAGLGLGYLAQRARTAVAAQWEVLGSARPLEALAPGGQS